MQTYSFTLFAQGPDVLADEAIDALFAAGCDDRRARRSFARVDPPAGD